MCTVSSGISSRSDCSNQAPLAHSHSSKGRTVASGGAVGSRSPSQSQQQQLHPQRQHSSQRAPLQQHEHEFFNEQAVVAPRQGEDERHLAEQHELEVLLELAILEADGIPVRWPQGWTAADARRLSEASRQFPRVRFTPISDLTVW